ncbi:MAG: flagellin lysine-N-methylase [Oscillospiraceae bacterium]
MSYYRQPEFYHNFRCMGGSCPSTCCALWVINWTPEEVDRLKQADCSPELRSLIDSCFVEDKNKPDTMKVSLSAEDNMQCPFLDEKHLCRIQKELGEDYLSYVCKIYPRTFVVSNDSVMRTCCTSCPAVMNILRSDENAMRMVSAPIKNGGVTLSGTGNTPELLEKYPAMQYRDQLVDFFFEIISNKKRKLEVSILLGALAAQKLTQFVDKGQHDRIPEIIKTLRPQLNCDSIPAFDTAVADPELNPALIAKVVNKFANTSLMNSLLDGDILRLSRYAEGRRIADEYFAEKPHILRNIALNMFLTGGMPFMMPEESIFMNYSYFTATVCAAKFVAAAAAYDHKAVTEQMFSIMCYYIRGMYHNINRSRIALNMLKESGCASPAFLAILLK